MGKVEITSFERVRELIHRIGELKEELNTSLANNSSYYASIKGVFNVSGISEIVDAFTEGVEEKGTEIIDNLTKLEEFMTNQVNEYEKINVDTEARFQQTQGELISVAEASESSLNAI